MKRRKTSSVAASGSPPLTVRAEERVAVPSAPFPAEAAATRLRTWLGRRLRKARREQAFFGKGKVTNASYEIATAQIAVLVELVLSGVAEKPKRLPAGNVPSSADGE